MKTLVLQRFKYLEDKTTGELKGEGMKTLKTLEPEWNYNKKNISCIPNGEYIVIKRSSKKFKDHWYITGVRNRSLILIHCGNYRKDTEGCILIGTETDNNNNLKNSKIAMGILNNYIQGSNFKLIIQ